MAVVVSSSIELVSSVADGVSSTMAYASAYAFMTLGAFACILAMRRKGQQQLPSDFNGLNTPALFFAV